ncbi:Exosome complex [Nesidiocoris tenuis]|uniref:Ribosomal RNA-processing protein 42 n=1 Tax=Nesidiocoris tenuis TaxID=355587 RepID=A0ABN7ARH8_9HEMI|nr:Exosome complex [Nesidiocoris tenuis]
MVLLSPEEKIYIVHGVEHDVRVDGRSRIQFRPIEVETDVIPLAMGSSRVRIGNTDVTATAKANIFTPPADRPAEGRMEVLVHFSGVGNPEFEGRTSEQMRDEYTHIFNKLYSAVRFNDWCIVEGVKCWKFNMDVAVMSLDGNLYDAVGLAIKAALATACVPSIQVQEKDEGEVDFALPDDPGDTWTPDVMDIPVFVTASKIGDYVVVDATLREEQCASFSCISACTENGRILFVTKVGGGSIHPTTMSVLLKKTSAVGAEVNGGLVKMLSAIRPDREVLGYL